MDDRHNHCLLEVDHLLNPCEFSQDMNTTLIVEYVRVMSASRPISNYVSELS